MENYSTVFGEGGANDTEHIGGRVDHGKNNIENREHVGAAFETSLKPDEEMVTSPFGA